PGLGPAAGGEQRLARRGRRGGAPRLLRARRRAARPADLPAEEDGGPGLEAARVDLPQERGRGGGPLPRDGARGGTSRADLPESGGGALAGAGDGARGPPDPVLDRGRHSGGLYSSGLR